MIATVVLSTVLASLTFIVAATCAEHALRAMRRPTRVPWVITSAACAALPLGQLLAFSITSTAATLGAGRSQPLPLTTILTAAVMQRFDTAGVEKFEYLLLMAWIVTSLGLGVRLFLSSRALDRLKRTWKRSDVAGVQVWMSDCQGPAVVGLRHPRIVVPSRIAELSVEQQRLALAHELEHIAAQDQWLVRAAKYAVALVPWNPAVWFAAQRLRDSIELDCDARVLQECPNVSAYASLVVSVASWRRASPAGALALGEMHIAQLERRLRFMTVRRKSRSLARAILSLIGAVALTLYGCDVATNVERPNRNDVLRLPTILTTATQGPNPYTESQVDKPVSIAPGSAAPRYPDALRLAGIEGEVLVQFVVNTDGRADLATFKALQSSDDRFTQAVRSVLRNVQFIPAEVRGRRVRQLVEMPFAFRIASKQ